VWAGVQGGAVQGSAGEGRSSAHQVAVARKAAGGRQAGGGRQVVVRQGVCGHAQNGGRAGGEQGRAGRALHGKNGMGEPRCVLDTTMPCRMFTN